jgi:type VI secretion system protein ImpA
MPSPEVLDFASLLAPIAEGQPTGADLRADASPSSPYYAVKDARSSARAAERQALGEEDGQVTLVDWRPVLQRGTGVLSGQSKDLEVAAYVVEALVRQHGFPGLRDGFRLVRELVEQFWDTLYPLPDEDGVETRVAPLTGLNGDDSEGTLIAPINNILLTQGVNFGPFAFHHYQQAVAVSQIVDEEARQRRIAAGAVPLENIQRAVGETPAEFFRGLVEDLTACQEEFTRLCTVLDEKCGHSSPPSSNIRSALAGCLEAVNTLARDKLAAAAAAEEAPPEAGQAASEGTVVSAATAGPAVGVLRTREDAFEMLLKVADYFRRTEPHTPVSYALEQAVRWGRMGLPELLTELIPDETARQQLFKQVGIKPPEAPSSY